MKLQMAKNFTRIVLFRLCLPAMAICLPFGAAPSARAQGPFTYADVGGVKGCSPSTSRAMPAVVTCGTVGVGSTGGFAEADYGVLRASASSGSASGNVISIAQFGDSFVLVAPPVGAKVGITFSLDGTISGVGSGATANATLSGSSADNGCVVAQTGKNGPFSAVNTCYVTPNTGQSGGGGGFGVFFSLEVQAKFGSGVVADFSSTAKITAVGFYDANNNLISPVTLKGASGTIYGAPAAPPEAYNQFDPATHDLVLFGRDARSRVAFGPIQPVSVTPLVSFGPLRSEMRSYNVVNQAGATLQLTEKVLHGPNLVAASIISLQYGQQPAITMPFNLEGYGWALDDDGSIGALAEVLQAGPTEEDQRVNAIFTLFQNETNVEQEEPEPESTVVKPGLALLRMATSAGKLSVEF